MTRMSLKVLRGVDLVAKDRNWVGEDSSDPYCKIYINGKQIARTPVQYKTTSPIWGGPISTFEFEGDPKSTEILVEIYDFNHVASDKRMGKVSFVASNVLAASDKNRYPNVWLPVESLGGCKSSGELEVHMLRLPPKSKQATNGDVRTNGTGSRGPSSTIPGIEEDGPPGRAGNELRESAIATLSAGPKLRAVGMGKNKMSLKNRILESRCPVTVHVYDVSNDGRVAKFNAVSKAGLRGGIFHAAVEVYGREYSFGGSRVNTTGIFACRPRKCPMHHYRESLFLGDCDLTVRQVDQILRKMKPEWMAPTYDLFRKNCCFFSKEFAIELGVGHIPEWIYSLADVGAAIDDYRIKREKARKEKERMAVIKEQERLAAIEAQKKAANVPRITNTTQRASVTGESVEITQSLEGTLEITQTVPRYRSIKAEGIEISENLEGGLEITHSFETPPTQGEAPGQSGGGGGGGTGPPPGALPKIGEGSDEVDAFVTGIETGVLDNVMAARVQRAYRASVAQKKRRADSMRPGAAAAAGGAHRRK